MGRRTARVLSGPGVDRERERHDPDRNRPEQPREQHRPAEVRERQPGGDPPDDLERVRDPQAQRARERHDARLRVPSFFGGGTEQPKREVHHHDRSHGVDPPDHGGEANHAVEGEHEAAQDEVGAHRAQTGHDPSPIAPGGDGRDERVHRPRRDREREAEQKTKTEVGEDAHRRTEYAKDRGPAERGDSVRFPRSRDAAASGPGRRGTRGRRAPADVPRRLPEDRERTAHEGEEETDHEPAEGERNAQDGKNDRDDPEAPTGRGAGRA